MRDEYSEHTQKIGSRALDPCRRSKGSWALGTRMDQTQIKQLIQAAEQAWYACPPQTCLIRGCPKEQNTAHQTQEQKKCLKLLIECLMAFKFYQTRPNRIKHIQTRSNSTVQTVICLVSKQCFMVFGRQTFIVCPGL